MKDTWNSLKENIKERGTNPFLGTFVIVWIANNWQVVYSFFYFDKDWKLEHKIQYFNNYWENKSFFWNLISVAAITVGILIVTYLFLAISRYLADSFENRVIPFIKRISKGKIVSSEIHEAALERISFLEEKAEIERKAKNSIIQERDELERKINPGTEIVNNQDNDEFARLISKMLALFKRDDIEKIMLNIAKGIGYGNNIPIIDYLLKNGIIELEKKGTSSAGTTNYFYKFTTTGNIFKKSFFEVEV